MQQLHRRRRRPASWQLVLVWAMLALAVVVSVSPSFNQGGAIALAQHQAADGVVVQREAEDEDAGPTDAASEQDVAPSDPDSAAPETPEIEPIGEIDETEDADQPGADEALPASEEEAEEASAPGAPVVGNVSSMLPAPNPSIVDCPADLGAAKAASFGPEDRLVMTYYYYWYDDASLEDPALSQRPPSEPPLDWRSVSWHERQLADMATAGIDVALAVYWGDTAPWSVEALGPMVEARERLLADGLRPPAIGLFFDTNMYAMILPEQPELADLTTGAGLDMLAYQVGGFLARVPPCHLARVDGRPLAFFWRADTEDGDHFTFDDRTFAGLTDLIAAEYGERLHLAVEASWREAAVQAGVELGAMDIYRWGAALNGPRFEGRTVAVGPGYDDRRIDGRPGYTRERIDGATYSRDLRQAVMSGTTWLLLETWNELWEGTAIAETAETGRTYLGITARYAALFHQLGRERARDGWFDLGSGHNAYLRRRADAPVEQGMSAEEGDLWGARPFREDDDGTGYFHFALDRRLSLDEAQPLTVEVEYFDEGDGSFALEYDSLDPEAPDDGIFKATEPVWMEDTRTWRTHRFELTDASLRHRQYDGDGDFRIHDRPGSDERLHLFGRVLVTGQPAERPVPFEPESLTFVKAGPREALTLRWSELSRAAGYLVVVQPFGAGADGYQHGFTADERRRCHGEAEVERTTIMTRGLTTRASCQLRLAADLEEGTYRWRVQALDADGVSYGEPSDWSFFFVVRH